MLEDRPELFKVTLYSFLTADQRTAFIKAVGDNIQKLKELDLERVVAMVIAGAYLNKITNGGEDIDDDEFRSILLQSSYISKVEEARELRQKTLENYLLHLKYVHSDWSEDQCKEERKQAILKYIEKMEKSGVTEEIELPKITVDWKEVFTRARSF